MSQDLIPVRMLVQFVYCHRLAYMEWVQGEFASNFYVVDGKYQHRNVDRASGGKKLQEDAEETIHASSITVSDSRLGIVAKIDRMEKTGKTATPVEYKRGKTPDTPTKWYDSNMVQVCAQALLLRANGYECAKGVIYYAASKERVEITFTEEMVAMTLQAIADMKEMAAGNTIPPPLVDSPKCPKCSLVGICLPDETAMLSAERAQGVKRSEIRRMYPMRADSRPVYVQEQGARISKSGETLKVKTVDGRITSIRLIDVSEVSVFGNIQITTQAIREMCDRNIPVCYLSYGGWFVGMTAGPAHKNIELRICQHKRYHEKNASLHIAREIVHGKIRNCATMLRRNHKSSPGQALAELEGLAKRAKRVRRYDSLLGLEGLAARAYFANFSGMIRGGDSGFDFTGRNRRPPKDPINAMLSFLYSMLVREAVTTITRVGLDPHLGYLHVPKYGRPALALDMIEEFRPIVADSVCITMVNTNQITDADFQKTPFGTNLIDTGRRKVIAAFGNRMDSTVAHPLLGYSASYRRIMETQARLLSRHLLGEIPSYPAFRTK